MAKKKPCGCKGLCPHGRIERKTRMNRGAGPTRKTRINPINTKRKKKEFARTYDSVEYVRWLHQFPCEVCGVPGWTQAAHTKGDGAGRKADVEWCAPLCGDRLGIKGCHSMLDDYEIEEHRPRLQRRAKHYRRMYLKHHSDDGEDA